jgi:nucleoside-diphosphate-sugar epimerase
MSTSVLVTGGFGFIGSHVVRRLLQGGNRVVVIDRHADGNAADEILSADERRAVLLVATDIPATAALSDLFLLHGVEMVVHLASPLSIATEAEPGMAVEGMILPHLAILDAALHARVRRVVWASSVGVFGRSTDYPTLPIPNDARHQPLTLYGAAKSFLEQLSRQYTASHGLDTLGLRFPLVYGPGRQRGGGQFTTRLIEGAALGDPCVAEGVDDRYDWMYVTDAARSVELALRADTTPSRALTVGGEAATVGDVAELLQGWLPAADITVQRGSSELVADYDAAPARDEIGYVPLTPLREGVLATVNAVRRRAGLPLVA